MLDALIDLVMPVRCVGCLRAGRALCDSCARPDPVRVELAGLSVCAAAPYDGGVRAALLAFKERDRRDLAGPLAAMLGAAVRAHGLDGPLLVPVPSSAVARRARGGDHVLRLARRVGPCTRPVRLVRSVRDSAGLDVAARAANLEAAMRARAPTGSRRAVLLVDDIVTTGATLGEAARALRAAGWQVAGAAVVAATQRRFPATEAVPP